MTTPSTERKAGPLLGTGAQTAWPFTFKVFAATDIAVTIANSLGTETALVYAVDYNVTLNANQETSPGGTITYPIIGSPLPTGSRLVILGNLPYDQPLDLPSGGNFSPLALENELDRLTMQIQQLREIASRAFQVSATTNADVSLPAPSSNQLIGWDSTGGNLQNVPLESIATALAFATYRYDTFTGTGAQTQFTLSADPAVLGNLDVAVGGVTQTPGADYTLLSGVLVFSSAPPLGATILARYGEGLPPGTIGGANDVSYTPGGTGAVTRTVENKLREFVSVKDFGAVGDGATDDTTAIQDAINTGKRVYIPAGTYKCNVTINNKTIIEGDGSLKTILKPYNDAIAVMTYTFTAMQNPIFRFWDYHSEIRDIGFFSNSAMTGVGFTFGKTNPADYQTNDEYANNVKFYGCYFRGFDKGLQFPFGHIGTEIYSCGFNGNKYGVYTLNNKFGAVMHAGCKYFYGGEFSGNTVAIYIHNAAADGFGGITLTGTIIEGNQIGIYAYISPRVKDPIMLDAVWFENNGATRASPGSSVIDAWSGSTRSNQTVTNKTVIIDGVQSKINFHSMFVCDVHIKATQGEVLATGCRVEASPGFGGAAFVVDYPETSYIRLENPYTDGGWYASGTYMPYVTGMGTNPATMLGTAAQLRCFQTNARGSKVTNYGPSLAMATPLTSAASTSGTFPLTGSVVSDGRVYNQCNEFTRAAFAGNQFTRISTPNTAITTAAGWYVFTLDAKVVSGAGVRINVWDRGSAQMVVSVRVNKIGYWQTFAAVAYSAGSQTLYLDFSGNDGDVTWRVSAYQIHRFDTQQEAFMFLQSNVFAES